MNAPSSTDRGGSGLAEREFPGTHGAATAAGLMRTDTSTALLRTIAEVLDIRAVFPRVSEIVKPAPRSTLRQVMRLPLPASHQLAVADGPP